MSRHLCGEDGREEAERNKTTVMEYSLVKVGIRKPGWIETGGSGRSGRQELKKGSLGDRDVKPKREGNRREGRGVCPIQSFLSITVNQGELGPGPKSDTGCCRHHTRLRSSHLNEPMAPWL